VASQEKFPTRFAVGILQAADCFYIPLITFTVNQQFVGTTIAAAADGKFKVAVQLKIDSSRFVLLTFLVFL
jgi:hypothetical protein